MTRVAESDAVKTQLGDVVRCPYCDHLQVTNLTVQSDEVAGVGLCDACVSIFINTANGPRMIRAEEARRLAAWFKRLPEQVQSMVVSEHNRKERLRSVWD